MSGAGAQLGLLVPGSASGSGRCEHEPPVEERQGWFLTDRAETEISVEQLN